MKGDLRIVEFDGNLNNCTALGFQAVEEEVIGFLVMHMISLSPHQVQVLQHFWDFEVDV
jgi:hypothetical protein